MMEALLDGPFGRIDLSAPVFAIGRASANQLVLDDKKASGYHAEIRSLGQEGGYSITDLGSTNGTFVNEQRLEQRVPRTLVNGEIIRIGDTSFLYVVPEVQEVTPTFYSPLDRQGVAPTVYAQPPNGQGIPPDAYAQQGVPPVAYAQPSSALYNNAVQSTVAAPPPFTSYTPQSSLPPVLPLLVSVPTQPQKRNLLWLWLTLGGIGLLVVVILVSAIANAATPSKTLDAFCTNMKNGNYHAAYTEFSPSYQQRTPERLFVGVLTLANVHFASCTYGSISENGDTANTTLTLQTLNGRSETDQVMLTKDSNSNWKISYLQGPSRG
ncbi:MAG TPA: FHA domain-containing protein [Ktedonobacteraceae bacterium]|nr:FHA domain-containing protein [Ktedonobacteraceae bacterium]